MLVVRNPIADGTKRGWTLHLPVIHGAAVPHGAVAGRALQKPQRPRCRFAKKVDKCTQRFTPERSTSNDA